MLNLFLEDKLQNWSLWHQKFVQKELQRSESHPSPDIVRAARELDSISWGQRPVPACAISVQFSIQGHSVRHF